MRFLTFFRPAKAVYWTGALVISLLFLAFTGSLSLPAFAASVAATASQFTYVNPNLGYSVQIPTGWVLNSQEGTVFWNTQYPNTHIEIDVQPNMDAAAFYAHGTPTMVIGNYPTIKADTPGGVQAGYPCMIRIMLVNTDIVEARWCGPNATSVPAYTHQFEGMLATFRDHGYIYNTTYTSVAPNSDGQLEAFMLGADHNIWHASQTTPSGYWTRWTPLRTGYIFSGQPVVGINADGRLEVFVRARDNTIYHAWETLTGSSTSWYGWAPLQAKGSPQFQGTPSVAMNSDGRLEIIARGVDNRIWHNYQTTANGTWSGWTQLEDILDTNDPVIAANANGMLEIFACGGDHHISTAWEATPGSSTSWSNWIPLPSHTIPYFQGTPSVALNSDGRLEIVARDADGSLWHNYQTVANGSWAGWVHLTSQKFQSDPMIGTNANGMLEIFARGSDANVWTAWEATIGSSTSWSNWVLLQRNSHYQFQGTPAVALNADGRLKVSVEALDGSMWTNIQTTPNGSWSGWDLFHLDPNVGGSN